MMRFKRRRQEHFCKLEVLDTNGELRLAQTALYAGGTSRIRYCIR